MTLGWASVQQRPPEGVEASRFRNPGTGVDTRYLRGVVRKVALGAGAALIVLAGVLGGLRWAVVALSAQPCVGVGGVAWLMAYRGTQRKMTGFLLASFYATMAAAGLVVEFVFQGAGLIPKSRNAKIEMASITWNYTTLLNIVFLLIAAALLWRFFTTGGRQMLRMMEEPTGGTTDQAQSHRGMSTLRS